MRLSSVPALGLLLISFTLSAVAQGELRLVAGQDGEQILTHTGPAGTSVLRESASEIRDLRLLQTAHSSEIAVLWTEVDGGFSTPWMALSIDGLRFQKIVPTNYELRLRVGDFDPAGELPFVPTALDVSGANSLWIVQFASQILPSFRDGLRALGAEVHFPLPSHAEAVTMNAATAALAKSLPYVRAVIPFQPIYKLDETLLAEQMKGFAAPVVRRVNVMAVRRDEATKGEVIAVLRDIGGVLVDRNENGVYFTAELTLLQVQALARHDLVQWMDLWTAPELDMDIARDFHGASFVMSTAGYDGTGVRGEVLDGGTLTTHVEFQANPLIPHGGLVNGSHGTSTYGQVFASGVRPDAMGMMPNGQGIAAFYNSYSGGSRANHTAELVNPAQNFRAVFQTNSWGGGRTLNYTAESADFDQIIYNSGLLITQSQSNAGSTAQPRDSRPQAWSKNPVSVGGIRHRATLTRADDDWSGAGSIGPAADGRTKPDLASFYDSILTTNNTSNTSYTTSFGGTSGATPIVAGTFGLFFQMWADGIFNNAVTAGDVFDNRAAYTTAKAMMVNTAVQWPFSGTVDPNRDHQGYGNPDVERVYNLRNSVFVVDANDPVTPLGARTYSLTVPAGTPEFLATLTWTEEAGAPGAPQVIVNDLDLRVTAPNGLVYWGNQGLRTAMTSSAGGGPDTINTLEKIVIPSPTPGVWVVEVIGSNIARDNNPATATLDASFSLVVHGIVQGPPPPPPFGLQFRTTPGLGDLFIGIQSMPAAATRGYTLFSLNTSGSPGSGPLLGLNPDLLTIQGLASPIAPGNLFHFPVGISGLYPDTPFDFPAGSVFLTGLRTDGMALVFDGTGAVVGQSRVVRVIW